MFNIICWNIRGIRSKGTLPYLKLNLAKFKPSLLVLLEPLAPISQLDKLRRSLSYDGAMHGGDINNKIWILWNNDIRMEDISWSEQHVSFKTWESSIQKFTWCSFVYAKCDRLGRQELWENLVLMSDLISGPWIVGGDFNAITHPAEKLGKCPADTKSILDFNTFLLRAGLSDAGFIGNRYTWTNNRKGDDVVMERLDRFLINGNFLAGNGNPIISHLSIIASDHAPLLCKGSDKPKSPARFHYMKVWQSHVGLRECIKSAWNGGNHSNPMQNFSLKLGKLRSVLKRWNWEIFGDQNQKEQRIIREIDHFQQELSNGWNPVPYRNLLKSKTDLENTLLVKEGMLKDKARISWLKDGDRNSAFYHASIKARRAKNSFSIRRADGTLSSDSGEVGMAAVEYYTSLFNNYCRPPDMEYMEQIPNKVTGDMNTILTLLPTEEEIKTALMNMNPEGAPGPDGFSVHFYLFAWDIIKLDLISAIQLFFKGFQMPRSWSATTITLIPKVQNPTSIDQLRPISLCNVCHKIISRILATRLGEILPLIISPEQAGFVKGRGIHENIVLAHDIAHDLHKSGADGNGNVIVKLDMSKAYDRISWSFLIRIMRAFGFNELWCDLIYRNISNNWYSISLENQSYGFFKSSCGVRQGDPLSPSLFVLAMDWFSRSLNHAIYRGDVKAYRTKRGAEKVHHLLFADDILIFTKDCPKSMGNLLTIIDEFCEISGEILNPSKSQIFFSKRITATRKQEVLDSSNFVESHLPTKYLGAPLFQGRVKSQYFGYLLDNLSSRIHGWMRNLLSMSGRLALIQSVLSSMSTHVMSVLPIPKKNLKQMHRLILNFLWDQGTTRKHHWVSLEKICRPKQEGGLGIINLMDSMEAMHGKLAWKYLEQNNLWARYAKARFTVGKSGSPIWNSIGKHINFIRTKSYWDVGNGDDSIEQYLWHLERPCSSEFAGLSVKEVLARNPLRFKFISMVPDAVKSYFKEATFTGSRCTLRWIDTGKGNFSNKEYLHLRRRTAPTLVWGKTIWQQWLPPRFSLLLWRIIHNGLPTDENLRRMGIQGASRCHCCLREEETLTHLFLEGCWATKIWDLLVTIFDCPKPSSVCGLTDHWLNNYVKKDAESNLKLGLTCKGLHYIWSLRNNRYHDEPGTFDHFELIKWAGFLVNLIPKGNADSAVFRRIQMLLGIPYNIRSTLEGQWSVWCPDNQGLTMDVAISEDCATSSILIRDNRGVFALADLTQINPILCAKDLADIINKWRNRSQLEISTIAYSHHFDCSDMLQHWKSDVRIKKVHPLILRASMSLCSLVQITWPVYSFENLPRATQRLIFQDRAKLRIFCPSEVSSEHHLSRITRHSDDVPNKRSSLPRFFHDDTNT